MLLGDAGRDLASADCMPDVTVTAGIRQARSMAGLTPAGCWRGGVVHDAFTINTILFLENLGFAKAGGVQLPVAQLRL